MSVLELAAESECSWGAVGEIGNPVMSSILCLILYYQEFRQLIGFEEGKDTHVEHKQSFPDVQVFSACQVGNDFCRCEN